MNSRYSFYRTIHKGIRLLLADLVEVAGRTDFAEAQSLASLRNDIGNGFELLGSHGHHEDTFIGPELQRLFPELANRIGGKHRSHEPEMAELLASLASIDPSSPCSKDTGHRFVIALSTLCAELMLHMADEEQLVMPALWTVLSDEQLIAIEQRLVASIPPEMMGRYLRWMLPAMNTPERIQLLGAMRSAAPELVYKETRSLARSLISPADDEALSRGLAEAA